jgi:hypothetical protein
VIPGAGTLWRSGVSASSRNAAIRRGIFFLAQGKNSLFGVRKLACGRGVGRFFDPLV